ncbi:head GIN domain-containing protein [Qipengyuania nanhaisediminis]|uniref:head GIN domain-containing protein n=1 Tax=Qipengyuania nanhaisediminis TaxID=604088 RepID=UPI0038B25B02
MLAWIAKRATPIAALVLGSSLTGCAYMDDWDDVDGVPLAELDLSQDTLDTISLAGPDSVIIATGDTLAISLEGDSAAGEALRFDHEDDRLSIARDRKVYDGSGRAVVQITMPPAANLEIAGSGTITADRIAGNAELEIAGSGDIAVADVDAERLEVEIAGSGTVRASGSADMVHIEIAGSGDVLLAALSAEDVTVEIAGSGDVEVASDGRVTAEIAGSGDVVVVGSATCSVQSAGSGSLTCRPRPDGDVAAGSGSDGDEANDEDAGAED